MMASKESETDQSASKAPDASEIDTSSLEISSFIGIESTKNALERGSVTTKRTSGFIFLADDADTDPDVLATRDLLNEEIYKLESCKALSVEMSRVDRWLKGANTNRPTQSWHSIVGTAVDALNSQGSAPCPVTLVDIAEDNPELAKRFIMPIEQAARTAAGVSSELSLGAAAGTVCTTLTGSVRS
ncbi:hypothetical protein IAT40_005573 [Kwoniella sp. CBS 6097]